MIRYQLFIALTIFVAREASKAFHVAWIIFGLFVKKAFNSKGKTHANLVKVEDVVRVVESFC